MANRKILSLGLSLLIVLSFAQVSWAKGTYSKHEIKKKIIMESKKQGVDPVLCLSVAKQESNFNKTARSCKGAVGVFQLMPATAKGLGVNPYYLNQNIKGGIKYLKRLQTKFKSKQLILAAYNAGPGAVRKYNGIPPYKETKNYVAKIMKYYESYKRNPDPALIEIEKRAIERRG